MINNKLNVFYMDMPFINMISSAFLFERACMFIVFVNVLFFIFYYTTLFINAYVYLCT